MAWAQDMKNLAADIKTSHQDRTARLGEIKRETGNILGAADDYVKKVAAELKEMAKNLKAFLADSEGTRKKDFEVLLKGIQDRIEEIKDGMKDFIAQSEEKRMVDFKTIMKDIKGDIELIKKSAAATMQSTKDLISGYTSERKDAARYWTGAGGKEGAEEMPAAPKRGRRRGRPKK